MTTQPPWPNAFTIACVGRGFSASTRRCPRRLESTRLSHWSQQLGTRSPKAPSATRSSRLSADAALPAARARMTGLWIAVAVLGVLLVVLVAGALLLLAMGRLQLDLG